MKRSRMTRQLSRKELKEQRTAARAGDVVAAERILAHSITLRHRRLSLRRYFLARACGSARTESFRPYCERIAAELPHEDILHMARDVLKLLDQKSQ